MLGCRRRRVAIFGCVLLLASIFLFFNLPQHLSLSLDLTLGLSLGLYTSTEPTSRPIRFTIPSEYHHYIHVFNVSRPWLDRDLHCVPIGVHPNPPVCLYAHGDQLSEQLTHNGGVYDADITGLLKEFLTKDTHIGLLDIGAGVGYFTLLAAAMGHPVLAVEPLPENTRRLGRAARLAGTQSRIMLLQNAVSNRHEIRQVNSQVSDTGDSTLEGAREACRTRKGGCPFTRTIYLDDLVPFIPFKRAILRLHVSGYELRALQRASVLFDHFDIQIVFMNAEWFWRDSGKKLMEFFKRHGYRPYTAYLPCVALNTKGTGSWPGQVMWVKDKEPKPAIEVV